MQNPKQPYEKPALNLEEQLRVFEDRGLAVHDKKRARHYLDFIGYFRLTGYSRSFRDLDGVDQEKYRPGTSFEDVLNLYIFDRLLRVHMMDALERIEVGIKAYISNSVSAECGPFWITEPDNFSYRAHDGVMVDIRSSVKDGNGRNHHDFITHFQETYTNPFPPSWMLMEVLSFGAISRVYKNLRGKHRTPVAGKFNVQHAVLESWLHALTNLRNICAHHGRLWNRNFIIRPKIPKRAAVWQEAYSGAAANKLYTYCGIINHMMGVIADGSRWAERLAELLEQHPEVDKNAMGFPNGWQKLSFWS